MLRLFCSIFLLGYCLTAHAMYGLQPKQVANNTWVLEGSTDNFSNENGGNIVNIAFIVAGVIAAMGCIGAFFIRGSRPIPQPTTQGAEKSPEAS